MLAPDDPWRARIQALDRLSPAATTHRYPTPEGRLLPPPSKERVLAELAEVEQLLNDVKRAVTG